MPKFAVLYDEQFYIDTHNFTIKEVKAYRINLWDSPQRQKSEHTIEPGARLEIVREKEDHYLVRIYDGAEFWLGKLQVQRIENE